MNLDQVIEASHGHFIRVRFIKKDGSVRTMLCRTGVTKHSKGGDNHLSPAEFFTVWDLHAKGYRAINKRTILSVTLKGTSWINLEQRQ